MYVDIIIGLGLLAFGIFGLAFDYEVNKKKVTKMFIHGVAISQDLDEQRKNFLVRLIDSVSKTDVHVLKTMFQVGEFFGINGNEFLKEIYANNSFTEEEKNFIAQIFNYIGEHDPNLEETVSAISNSVKIKNQFGEDNTEMILRFINYLNTAEKIDSKLPLLYYGQKIAFVGIGLYLLLR